MPYDLFEQGPEFMSPDSTGAQPLRSKSSRPLLQRIVPRQQDRFAVFKSLQVDSICNYIHYLDTHTDETVGYLLTCSCSMSRLAPTNRSPRSGKGWPVEAMRSSSAGSFFIRRPRSCSGLIRAVSTRIGSSPGSLPSIASRPVRKKKKATSGAATTARGIRGLSKDGAGTCARRL